MKKYIKSFLKSLFIVMLASGLFWAGIMVFSDPGMGVPDDEAAALEAAFASGGWDAFEAEADKWERSSGSQSHSTSAPKSSSNTNIPVASTPKPTTQKQQTKTKEYSHDYDSITDLAKEAFEYFTHDGTPDSVYLNIKESSSDNTITGKELNATTTGSEDGRISFVDDDKNVKYEYLISNWNSDDDYHIDLTASFEKYDTKDFEEAYTLRFGDGGTIPEGNNLTFRVQTGLKDTELCIYVKGEPDENANPHTDSRATYEKIHTGLTDEDGFLELHPTELTEYIVSPGEPIMIEDEPEPEEVIEDEPVPEEPEVVNEPAKPAPAPVVTPEPEPEKKFPIFPVVIGVVVLLIALCVGIVIKKKK